ncbi:hypothetical protein OG930_15675 [Streptomyces sp. NBC_01799]|nr:hypothetical protein OG930_15675 [Streptomyces sp. NBC_01799]
MQERQGEHQLQAEAKDRPVQVISADQGEYQDEACDANTALSHVSPLCHPLRPQGCRILDRDSIAESTQLARPIYRKVDRPEQDHGGGAADLDVAGGTGESQVIHRQEDTNVRSHSCHDSCDALPDLSSGNPHQADIGY